MEKAAQGKSEARLLRGKKGKKRQQILALNVYFLCKTNLESDTKEVWDLINPSNEISGSMNTVKAGQQKLDLCTMAGGLRLSLISLA